MSKIAEKDNRRDTPKLWTLSRCALPAMNQKPRPRKEMARWSGLKDSYV